MSPAKPRLLFMTNREHGAANVHLAVSYEIMMQHHHDVEVHFASFPSLEQHVQAISAKAWKASTTVTEAPPIIFHAFSGPSITETISEQFNNREFHLIMTHPPGLSGALQSYESMSKFAAAWPGKDHLKLYNTAASIIRDISPTLVVLDPMFNPGIEACRNLNIKYVILSPNAMKDLLAQQQPRGAMFWKYPA